MNQDKNNNNEFQMHKIITKYSSSTFLEASSFSFPIDRVAFKFGKFDNNNKLVQSVDIYLKFEEVFAIYNGLFVDKTLFNQLILFKKEKISSNSKYYKSAKLYQGGTKKNGIVAKTLRIQPGDKLPYILKAEEGEGSVSNGYKGYGQGLIEMKGAPTKNIIVGFKHDELSGFLSIVVESIKAYLVAKEVHMFNEKYSENNQPRNNYQEQGTPNTPQQNQYDGNYKKNNNYNQPNNYQQPPNTNTQEYGMNNALSEEELVPSFDLSDLNDFGGSMFG